MNSEWNHQAGKRVEFAKQALVRYVRDQRLAPGARLAGRDVLCKELNLSSSTVLRAINALKEDGLFEVRGKVGTFLRAKGLAGKIGRNIGMTVPRSHQTMSPFFSCLSVLLQNILIQNGCQPMLFIREEVSEMGTYGVDKFPGLASAIRNKRIDGIIDLCDIDRIEEQHPQLPVVFVGNRIPATSGVAIDLLGFITNALEQVKTLDLERPALIFSTTRFGLDACQPWFDQEARRLGLTSEMQSYTFDAAQIREGRFLAAKLLRLPAERRPEVLIFTDELIGGDLLAGLLVENLRQPHHYQPLVITHCSPELPITLPWDRVISYQWSIADIAQRTVHYLLEWTRGQSQGRRLELVPCRKLPQQDFFAPNSPVNFDRKHP